MASYQFGRKIYFGSCVKYVQFRGCFQALGVTVFTANKEVADRCDVVILAVKPDTVVSVLKEVSDSLRKRNPLIVSVAAGIPIAKMEQVSITLLWDRLW